MRRISLLLAIIVSITTYGQQTKTGRLTLGIVFSPDYSYRTLTGDNRALIKARNSTEKAIFGYTGGLQLSFGLPSSLRLSTGVLYSLKGYQTEKFDFTNNPPDPVMPQSIQYVYNYKYIDIPLKVDFVFGKKSTKFTTGVGLTANFLMEATEKTTIEEANGTTTELEASTVYEENNFNISPTISFGLQSKLNEHLLLSVEPTFRYGILKLIDAPIKGHLWSAGINVGIHYVLK